MRGGGLGGAGVGVRGGQWKRGGARAGLQAERRAASRTVQAVLVVVVAGTLRAAGKVLWTVVDGADRGSGSLVFGGRRRGGGCSVAPLRVVYLQGEGVDEAQGSVGLAALQL